MSTWRWICEKCDPRKITKSEICKTCGEPCTDADEIKARHLEGLSPKFMKETPKPKSNNRPVKIESDFRNERRAKIRSSKV